MEASAIFDSLLKQVQNSKLNFKLDLSPFSAVIFLKKTFIKDRFGNPLLPSPDLPLFHCHQAENGAYEKLKRDFEDEINENEVKQKIILSLETKVKELSEKLSDSESKLEITVANEAKVFSAEKKVLQNKLENALKENKNLRKESEDSSQEINSLKTDFKKSKKEAKHVSYNFEKKVETLEEKLKDLNEYKNRKMSEEKDLKSKLKAANKKLKQIKEIEAELYLEKLKFEKKEMFIEKDLNENETKVEDVSSEEEVIQFLEKEIKPESEKITSDIIEILSIEPVSDIDFTIEKLESIKSLLKPKDSNEDYCAFDNIIAAAKETKSFIEQMAKVKSETEEDFEDCVDDDNYPRSNFDEEGNEIFFAGDES